MRAAAGWTGPGLKGKAPVFSGLGALIIRTVSVDPHWGQIAASASLADNSSNTAAQFRQEKSYIGMSTPERYGLRPA